MGAAEEFELFRRTEQQPEELAAPRDDPNNADPTPIRRFRAAVPRTTQRSRPTPSRLLPPMPGQKSTHRARLLLAHDHRRRLRRSDPRAALSVPSLPPPHGFTAPGIRPALSPVQPRGHRLVARRPWPPGYLAAAAGPAADAVPTRPVLLPKSHCIFINKSFSLCFIISRF